MISQRLTIYLYVGFLYLVMPFTGIWGTTARFLLKDHFHQSADAIAGFLFLVSIPAYFGFLFGFVRDRWNPLGRRDQGFLLICSVLTTLLLLAMAVLPITYIGLAVLFVASSIIGQFVASSQQGLTSLLAQDKLMTGRLSSVWQAAAGAPVLILGPLAGKLYDNNAPARTFLMATGVALLVMLFMLWRPKAVYDTPAEAAAPVKINLRQDIGILLKTPGVIVIVIMLFLWNFTPGVGTPIQFYLTDTLHGTAFQYGLFNTIFNGFFIPTFLLYGFLCTRMNYRKLLWFCTFLAVPQILPLLIVHDANSALVAGVPMGLMGGLATAAYFDLLIRACPKGLHGTAMMLGSSAWVLSAELGNLAGSHLYNRAGFPACAWATAGVYACLIPMLMLVPKRLTATRDGEALIPSPAI